MPPFDLHHLDTEENATWSDVQGLMDRCEAGIEGRPGFEIWEANEGELIVEVALAAMGETAAWILRKRAGKTSKFLARGNWSRFYECIYWGCPEHIRDSCLLSRSDAEVGIRTLIDQETLSRDWHWVPHEKVFDRSVGEPLNGL
jgi:hypothetical protein